MIKTTEIWFLNYQIYLREHVIFQACEHNTNGTKCDYCVAGYYGDATQGTPSDCQRCACPLVEASNNFSPHCELKSPDENVIDYICTDCPQGYDGDHCERYADLTHLFTVNSSIFYVSDG